MSPSFSVSFQVRYAETDAMGIVHHRHFLTWLEYARVRWLDVVGTPYKELEAGGYFIPVVEVQMRYRKPAFFDDLLSVSVAVVDFPVRARFHLSYEVTRRSNPLATGQTTHVFLNSKRQVVRPPEIFLSRLETWLHPQAEIALHPIVPKN
ncbi:MAG: acyl-CoA thioesterase [Puniceicoccales bacterium]|jgi:acyl-CoA thioester hydrolase|nr:acyl-CoA thioesterase [Puniceicoccales bacterium]